MTLLDGMYTLHCLEKEIPITRNMMKGNYYYKCFQVVTTHTLSRLKKIKNLPQDMKMVWRRYMALRRGNNLGRLAGKNLSVYFGSIKKQMHANFNEHVSRNLPRAWKRALSLHMFMEEDFKESDEVIGKLAHHIYMKAGKMATVWPPSVAHTPSRDAMFEELLELLEGMFKDYHPDPSLPLFPWKIKNRRENGDASAYLRSLYEANKWIETFQPDERVTPTATPNYDSPTSLVPGHFITSHLKESCSRFPSFHTNMRKKLRRKLQTFIYKEAKRLKDFMEANPNVAPANIPSSENQVRRDLARIMSQQYLMTDERRELLISLEEQDELSSMVFETITKLRTGSFPSFTFNLPKGCKTMAIVPLASPYVRRYAPSTPLPVTNHYMT